jgi:hypothetical protein
MNKIEKSDRFGVSKPEVKRQAVEAFLKQLRDQQPEHPLLIEFLQSHVVSQSNLLPESVVYKHVDAF